jgi:hypothetical protein
MKSETVRGFVVGIFTSAFVVALGARMAMSKLDDVFERGRAIGASDTNKICQLLEDKIMDELWFYKSEYYGKHGKLKDE